MLDRERLIGDAEYRSEARFRCQTDHFFLGRLLGYNKFVERIHRPVADLYVSKKPGLPIEQQDEIKNRLHLDPRGTYKTSFGIIDTIQWICGVSPDITILNETATKPLAKALTDTTVEAAFLQPKGKDPNLFQICFPEHVIPKQVSGEYFSPARTFPQPDATISSTGVDCAQSGWHPWILNPDDAVEMENSGPQASPKVRESVIIRHNTNVNTLRRGGYIHMRGTRYHPLELWGYTLDTMNPARWKVLVRSSLRTLDGSRLQAGEFPPEDQVELMFPEIETYEELKDKFKHYEAFMSQQMNDPAGGSLLRFTGELFGQSLVEQSSVPLFGETFIHWRFPFSGKDFMKYAEGVAMRIVHGHAYVIDAWQGIYTTTGLATKVVAECRKHQVGKVSAEDSPGARYLEGHIKNESYKQNVSLQINWMGFESDDSQRFARIEQLEPMMRSGRLSISTACGKFAEMKRQFVHYGLVVENGIIDSVSRLAIKIPVSLLRAEIDDEEQQAHRRKRMQMESDMVFGAAGQQAMEEQRLKQQLATMAPRNSYGLPDVLGGLDG